MDKCAPPLFAEYDRDIKYPYIRSTTLYSDPVMAATCDPGIVCRDRILIV